MPYKSTIIMFVDEWKKRGPERALKWINSLPPEQKEKMLKIMEIVVQDGLDRGIITEDD